MIFIRKINGRKYDARLLQVVEKREIVDLHTAKRLLAVLYDYGSYPDISKDTIKLIRAQKKWTADADHYFREQIRRWAANRSMRKQV